MDSRTQVLLTAPPLKLLINMATPSSVAFFVQACVSLAEIWFIGRLGTTSLAAIALVFPFLMLTQTLAGGATGGAVASAIARASGSGDTERAEKLIWHALAIAVLGALLLLLLYLLLGHWFLQFLGGQGEMLDQASTYSIILFSGGVSIWLLGILSAIFRGMGNMTLPAAMMILSACVQVPLSGALVLGGFGLPQLGVAGAAVSAVVAGTLVSLSMLAALARASSPIRLRISNCSFSRELFGDILRVALPASLSPILTVATIISLTAIVGRFGENALAGYGIGSRIEFLMIPLIFGLGAAMTSLVGMSVGARNFERAERIGWVGSGAAALVAGLVGLSLALVPGLWIPLFTEDPEIFAAAKAYIQIVGPAYTFFGLGLSLYFASQGAGAMLWPVLALLVRFGIAVGGALLLITTTSLSLNGVYYAASAGMVVYGIIIAAALKLGAWRQ
ncbi:MAG: MATE family efflux transporter [Pseudomonadaceae bacterium]|nr:MATE family efflux transporter [Pseudomonadaceae bacterium]